MNEYFRYYIISISNILFTLLMCVLSIRVFKSPTLYTITLVSVLIFNSFSVLHLDVKLEVSLFVWSIILYKYNLINISYLCVFLCILIFIFKTIKKITLIYTYLELKGEFHNYMKRMTEKELYDVEKITELYTGKGEGYILKRGEHSKINGKITLRESELTLLNLIKKIYLDYVDIKEKSLLVKFTKEEKITLLIISSPVNILDSKELKYKLEHGLNINTFTMAGLILKRIFKDEDIEEYGKEKLLDVAITTIYFPLKVLITPLLYIKNKLQEHLIKSNERDWNIMADLAINLLDLHHGSTDTLWINPEIFIERRNNKNYVDVPVMIKNILMRINSSIEDAKIRLDKSVFIENGVSYYESKNIRYNGDDIDE